MKNSFYITQIIDTVQAWHPTTGERIEVESGVASTLLEKGYLLGVKSCRLELVSTGEIDVDAIKRGIENLVIIETA